ncbi:class I SAM-dependent methyltransferase [Streptomyces siamensis]|uniref:class I SAM-dependent methyltransferase n=1 Tax=Streptomyces siamensis TaxID=1274986 RepID=UPI0031E8F85F
MTDKPDAAYTVSVEFYDLLQAERDRRQAKRRFTQAARRACRGILDIGAGTGIVTEVLLAESAAPVHVIEPAPAMRAALLTRLAHLGADRRARVIVHPEPVQEAGLDDAVDLAVASNVVACLDPVTRRNAWKAVASALVPGGLLLFDPPPAAMPAGPRTVGRLGPARVGPDTYSAELMSTPCHETLRITFTYRVERDGLLLREEREVFDTWPAPPSVIVAELRGAGLDVVRAPCVDLMAARRPGA